MLREAEVLRVKKMEQKNARLQKVVADLLIDNAILKEAALTSF